MKQYKSLFENYSENLPQSQENWKIVDFQPGGKQWAWSGLTLENLDNGKRELAYVMSNYKLDENDRDLINNALTDNIKQQIKEAEQYLTKLLSLLREETKIKRNYTSVRGDSWPERDGFEKKIDDLKNSFSNSNVFIEQSNALIFNDLYTSISAMSGNKLSHAISDTKRCLDFFKYLENNYY